MCACEGPNVDDCAVSAIRFGSEVWAAVVELEKSGSAPSIRMRCFINATKVTTMRSMIARPAGNISRNARRERDTIPTFARRYRATGMNALEEDSSYARSIKVVSSHRIGERRTTGVCANIFHVNRSESVAGNSQELARVVNLMISDIRRYPLLYVFLLCHICARILLNRPGSITVRGYSQSTVVHG